MKLTGGVVISLFTMSVKKSILEAVKTKQKQRCFSDFSMIIHSKKPAVDVCV